MQRYFEKIEKTDLSRKIVYNKELPNKERIK